MSSESSTTMQQLVTAAAGDEQGNINEFVARITAGEPKPLDAGGLPWFEQGVITEVDPHIWRSQFVEHYSTTVTDALGNHYFLIEDAAGTFNPRLLWQRGELFLARELSLTEADFLDPRQRLTADVRFQEIMREHEAGCYKTAERFAAEFRQWLNDIGDYPEDEDSAYVDTMLDEILND